MGAERGTASIGTPGCTTVSVRPRPGNTSATLAAVNALLTIDAIGGAQAFGFLSVQPASIEAVRQRCAAALRGQQHVGKVAEEQHRALA